MTSPAVYASDGFQSVASRGDPVGLALHGQAPELGIGDGVRRAGKDGVVHAERTEEPFLEDVGDRTCR